MNVVPVNIRGPGDDVMRIRKLFRLGTELDANHRFQAFFASGGADAAFELRSAQAVEKTAIHGSTVERAERTSVRVGQDRFGAIFGNDLAQATRNFVEGLIPRDAFKSRLIRWGDGMAGRGRPSFPQGSRSLRLYPSHRIQDPIRRVHAVQIFGDFGTKESAGNGMLRIALNFGGAAIFNGDEDAAGVRAVVRAGGVDDALHPQIIKDYKRLR